MKALARADQIRVDAVAADLGVVRLGEDCAIDSVFAEVHDIVGSEMLVFYSVAEHLESWGISRWHEAGCPREVGARFEASMRSNTVSSIFYYDPSRPPVRQRNRVVEATNLIDRNRSGTWESSAMFRDVLKPAGLEHHRQVRALICDGPSLLGWFGAIQLDPVTRRQNQILAALVRLLRARLLIEQQLQDGARSATALSVAIEHIGMPAFLLGAAGRIYASNAAGRSLLDHRRRETSEALQDALARQSTNAVQIIPVVDRGAPAMFLALVREDTIEARRAACVRECTSRWGLSDREAQVVELAVRGLANATIAAMLAVGERSVEHHMTAIFDRAGVDGRAALVARVLTSL